ncbi:MAG: CtsR family transcriptional regulator [Clostridium argentinense]|uniref:Transcriptional regulator CtsR n=1 Tax=Clostridium faecium TaxID=2762223 RepID=A0ABR8YTQ5_9CLOT|nr:MULTISPECIES: CtsR family transcriptional regulator [Clostridium]MBD8047658.1 CtsR family transcriptional regulator [Clostridium faecium]MBS5824536.1 CtsR family transcriptional regulator [Clostridium argentinense]MDU1350785.1 CtsR family transcriptional regulator [Clostridium argentinense]
MARLSDIIEDFIKEMIEETQNNEVEIQRNELANYFSCAPSQINYVLTTRFTKDKGYYIESRRGGGGYIRITRIKYKYHSNLLEAIDEAIGNSITYDNSLRILESLRDSEIINEREENIIKTALNDRTLSYIGDMKNKLRADILRAVIFNILN